MNKIRRKQDKTGTPAPSDGHFNHSNAACKKGLVSFYVCDEQKQLCLGGFGDTASVTELGRHISAC